MTVTITNGYCTLAELRDWAGNIASDDTSDDDNLSRAINAASRWIDKKTGQYFYKSSVDETRYFTAKDTLKIRIDPFVSITSVALDTDETGTWETSMASTEYSAWPPNAGTIEPYRELRIKRGNLVNVFPKTQDGVKVVGVFGWPSVPDDVKQACLLQAYRIYKRKDTPTGIEGTNQLGVVRISASDADVLSLLADYMGPRV